MSLPPEQKQKYYEYLLEIADSNKDGNVEASEAVPLFRKSGLTDQQLGQVWAAASGGAGNLNKQQFFTALGYIALLQAGQLPDPTNFSQASPFTANLPDFWAQFVQRQQQQAQAQARPQSMNISAMGATGGVETFVGGRPTAVNPSALGATGGVADPYAGSRPQSMNLSAIGATGAVDPYAGGRPQSVNLSSSPPAETPAPAPAAPTSTNPSVPQLSVNDQLKATYKAKFATLDPQNEGTISAQVAREFFLQSQLPTTDLAIIWGLADVTKDGKLDVAEFCIAFYLIQWRLSRRELPEALPASLLASVGLSAVPAAPKVPVAPTIVAEPPKPQPAANLIATNPTPSSGTATLGGGFNAAPGGSLLGILGATAHSTPYSPSHPPTGPSPSTSSANLLHVTPEGPSPHSTSPNSSQSNLPSFMNTNPIPPAPSGTSTPAYMGTNPTPGPTPSYLGTNPTASGAPVTAPVVNLLTTNPTPSYMGTNPTPGATPSAAPAGASGEYSWALAVEDRATYTGYFGMADPSNSGFVSAETARTLFSRSKLPTTALAKIWELSDTDNDRQLSLQEFMVAMHLINGALKGAHFDAIPDALRASVWPAGSVPAPAATGGAVDLLATNPLAAAAAGQIAPSGPRARPVSVMLPADTTVALQQQKLEEERRELERLKRIATDLYREKELLIKALRQQQAATVQIAQQVAAQESQNEGLRDSVGNLELDAERQKIKGASVREKHAASSQKLETILAQRRQFDTLLAQKKEQYQAESSHVQALQSQLDKNKEARTKQTQDLQSLRSQVEEMRKKQAMSQKVDADVLRQKLVQEQVRQASNPSLPLPAKQTPKLVENAFEIDDFGSAAVQPKSSQPPFFFPESHPIIGEIAREQDAFGKAAPVPLAAHPAPDADFFSQATPAIGTTAAFNPWGESSTTSSNASVLPESTESLPSADDDFAKPAVTSSSDQVNTSSPFATNNTSASSSNPFAAFAASPAPAAAKPSADAPAAADPFGAAAFGDSGAAPNPFGGGGGLDDMFKAPIPAASGGRDDFFAPLSDAGRATGDSGAAPNPFGGGGAPEDDFFKPLSDAGQKEGGIGTDTSAPAKEGAATLSAFDAPLFD